MITLWRVCRDHIFRRSVSGASRERSFLMSMIMLFPFRTQGEQKIFSAFWHFFNDLEVVFLDNRCVCCGEIIPEGLQICPVCEKRIRDGPINREGRRKSGSSHFWRWLHDFSLVAHSGGHDRRVHRHRAAGDLLSEQSQTGRKEMVGR